jgi:alpha-beta hydrolase superfamily lysophospholipase
MTMMDARNKSQAAGEISPLLPRSASEPLTFDGTVGLFTPPSAGTQPSNIAVLFASPWGLEEMCTRKFWRIISEKLADCGIASLRFDYPGTGDALDDIDFEAGLSVWSDSLASAATYLKTLSGCARIVVVSQGLGAVVATKAADAIEALDAIVYMAPVVSGRLHIRELAVWSKVVDENLGLTDEQHDKAGVSIASLTMPGEIADEVRNVNLLMLDRSPAARALVIGRDDRPSDKEFAARLRALGADVTEQAFEGYDKLVSNPVIVKMPLPVADNLTNWIAALPSEPASAPVRSPGPATPLAGDGFAETPVRFGLNSRLSGVLCEPLQARAGATVLFLTSAYDRHAGWGRATVALARTLARSGIPSLRFDTANVGDSPPVPGRSDQVLYHSDQNADVSEAIDFLEACRLTPVVVAGRCSGAYLGLQASLVEPRIAGNVSVNPAVFRWRPGRSVEDMIVNGARSLRDYRKRALRAETFKRILRGEVNTVVAVRNIARSVGNQTKGKILHAFRGFLPEGRAIYGAFRTLHQRGTPVSLIYSENDLGLEQYDFYFGHDGSGLARFPNVSPEIIPDADHNLTPEHARKVYLEALREMALRIPLEEDVYSKTGSSVAAE